MNSSHLMGNVKRLLVKNRVVVALIVIEILLLSTFGGDRTNLTKEMWTDYLVRDASNGIHLRLREGMTMDALVQELESAELPVEGIKLRVVHHPRSPLYVVVGVPSDFPFEEKLMGGMSDALLTRDDAITQLGLARISSLDEHQMQAAEILPEEFFDPIFESKTGSFAIGSKVREDLFVYASWIFTR